MINLREPLFTCVAVTINNETHIRHSTEINGALGLVTFLNHIEDDVVVESCGEYYKTIKGDLLRITEEKALELCTINKPIIL